MAEVEGEAGRAEVVVEEAVVTGVAVVAVTAEDGEDWPSAREGHPPGATTAANATIAIESARTRRIPNLDGVAVPDMARGYRT